MNQYLKSIKDLLQKKNKGSKEDNAALLKALAKADEKWSTLEGIKKEKGNADLLLAEARTELQQKEEAIKAQNRELEIETALEKVRVIALSMKEPDDMPDVCKVISGELDKLGVKEIRNVQTAIFYEDRGTYINYEYYFRHDKRVITETAYTNHEVSRAFAEKMARGKGEFYTTHISDSALTDWIAYQKTTNVFIDPFLETAASLTYYWYSLGPVALGISTYLRLTERDVELFKRFRNVFELAYRRYLDIELAVNQAKEARIETALERVRAVAMAMRKPEDLLGICKVLYEELQALEFGKLRNTMININNDEKNSFLNYDFSDTSGPTITHHFYDAHPVFTNFAKQIHNKNDAFAEFAVTDEALNDWKEFRRKAGEKDDPRAENISGIYYYFYSIGSASIGLSNFEPLNEERLQLLSRFKNVFALSYQRYTDISYAEKQAREARVETALERIRAVATAMRKSHELINVCEVMYKELFALGFANIRNTQIAIKNDAKQSYTVCEFSDHVVATMKEAPYGSSPLVQALYDELEKSDDALYQREFKGKEYEDWLNWRKNLDTGIDPRLEQAQSVGFYLYSIGTGHIGISTFSTITSEQLEILKRFRNVFELSYRRYTDVAQAEAQAREAEIQLAMERVRARTMAMQKSEELPEAASLLFQQVQSLGMPAWSAGYCIWDADKSAITLWMSSEGVLQPPFMAPLTEDASFIRMREGDRRGDKLFIDAVGGEELVTHYRYMRTLPVVGEILDSIIEAGHPLPAFQINHCAYFSWGFLLFITYEPVPEAHEIFKRFAKVFEQTYTRFLDLKKAEGQANEARIEAALERVRSRSLAMHKSDELQEVVKSVFDRFQELNIELMAASILIFEKGSKDVEWWLVNKIDQQLSRIKVEYADILYLRNLLAAKENNKELLTASYSRDEKSEFFNYFFEHTDFKNVPEAVKRVMLESTAYCMSVAIGTNVGILISRLSDDLFSEKENEVLIRFAKVFDQAYTRFLDLQKSEVQAREAQIQLAMERVRARTMAMQKSEELAETSFVLFQQFRDLGETSDQISIGVFNEEENVMQLYSTLYGSQWKEPAIVDLEEPIVMKKMYASWKEQKKSMVIDLAGDDLLKYNTYRKKLSSLDYKEKRWVIHVAFFSKGVLTFSTTGPRPQETIQLLERFAGVFDGTYTRFLDLEKAEAQAKEAKIEAALERTRTQSILMRHSKELDAALRVFHEQVQLLGIGSAFSFLWLPDEENDRHVFWAAWKEDLATVSASQEDIQSGKGDSTISKSKAINYPLDRNEPATAQCLIDWKSDESVHSYFVPPDQVKNYFDAWKELFEGAEKFKPEYFPLGLHYIEAFMKYGCFGVMLEKDLAADEKKVLDRFSVEFERTYTRFLDLQKAEAQVREAQIEAALERVRSKTMAMHNSEDIAEAVATLFDQLTTLEIEITRCGIGIFREPKQMEAWTARIGAEGKTDLVVGRLDMTMHPLLQGAYNGWSTGKDHFSFQLAGAEVITYYTSINNHIDYPIKYDLETLPTQVYHNDFYFREGTLYVFSEKALSPETIKIFKRFAGVFGQTYRRFLDLQHAEANARESKIEAAMEKVRARAMAMQKPRELVDVAQLLRREMGLLGVEELETSSIYLHDDTTGTTECWYAIQDVRGQQKELVADHMTMRLDDTWVGREMMKFYRSSEQQTSIVMRGEQRQEWIADCAKHSTLLQGYYGNEIPDRSYHLVKFSNGFMGAASPGEISAESWDLLRRANAVFSLAYTRFNDLQLAEAQAREATIEAALEKVRGQAMAMHNSNDLSSTASVLFTELRKLGIKPIRCGVGLLNRESRKAQLYSATPSAAGDGLALIGWVLLSGHPVLEGIYDSWVTNQDYFPKLEGEGLREYYRLLLSGLSVSIPDGQQSQTQFGHFLPVSIGCLYAWSAVPYEEAEIKILKRFATIVDLTFRRYLELQNSETNAREAVKQAALDRVRAEIASMRTVHDLEKITPLIWNELTILGTPFIRCGVFIMDETQELIHTFLSTPDGKAIAAFHIPYSTPGNISQVLKHWRRKSPYIDHWNESAFKEFANTLVQQGALRSAEQYLQTIPQGGFCLHFLPFLQGMLYVGNNIQLSEVELKTIQSIADAFSTAYARYEDFNKLESAKQEVEKTLGDLKLAQTQLVQSEKMASLGELTAGIAHEIQNPLNFVNNFSEVNKELIEELRVEKAKSKNERDEKLEEELLDDIVQNLEKINHHGKRADAIVKGMLQHSRSGGSVKEPTDINALVDEYLRLAYHGLRAKDPSFNTTLSTEFDPLIGKINVVPQDLGRVVLNLLTNAFYAVKERSLSNKATLGKEFQPVVSVATKKLANYVEIRVSDNGNGIPKKIVDKIFQPFFTTKPTGQGTGLGLSLSYDIVKVHGGELTVESEEKKGSTFVIQLPAK